MQTCGHLILTLQMAAAVNEVLAHGLLMCHKKVYAEKCKKEPIQCLKCHRWGHLARACSTAGDTCGTCAQKHRTDTCTNKDKPYCVPCGKLGHVSWDRGCLVFQNKCNEVNDRMEENSMPYFPMSEIWMQVQEPPKVVYIMPPQARDSQQSGPGQGANPTQDGMPRAGTRWEEPPRVTAYVRVAGQQWQRTARRVLPAASPICLVLSGPHLNGFDYGNKISTS